MFFLPNLGSKLKRINPKKKKDSINTKKNKLKLKLKQNEIYCNSCSAIYMTYKDL
jgi:hypothetical protein